MKQYLPTLQRDILLDGGSVKDEKFISIDFDSWEKKYKPMEARIGQLLQELQQERESHYITIRVDYQRGHGWAHRAEIARLDLQGGNVLTEEQRSSIYNVLRKDIEDHIFRSKKDFLRYLLVDEGDLDKVEQALLKMEETERRINKRLKGIGKFWRWLLKLK
jgi:hypothetical protein